MTLLINQAEPYLRILMEDGSYVQFEGGKLEIYPTNTVGDGDDAIEVANPYYERVMAEAIRRSTIAIMENATTCSLCGEPFAGKTAKAQLGMHRKQNHFDQWIAEKIDAQAQEVNREIKSRAGHACDVCQPVQTFGTDADLAEHVRLLHTKPPETDDEGNELGGEDGGRRRRGGEIDLVPAAARPSQ